MYTYDFTMHFDLDSSVLDNVDLDSFIEDVNSHLANEARVLIVDKSSISVKGVGGPQHLPSIHAMFVERFSSLGHLRTPGTPRITFSNETKSSVAISDSNPERMKGPWPSVYEMQFGDDVEENSCFGDAVVVDDINSLF
ncbi:hypothetical protein P9112_009867 [Eukaryota sp. TZLM1-RC]